MSYESVRKQRPPSLLVLLCLSLWAGVLFNFTEELIGRRVTNWLIERLPDLVPWFWSGLAIVALGQCFIFWCLLRGYPWARVATLTLVGFAALAFVPHAPLLLALALDFCQMPFKGWPDILIGFVGQMGFLRQHNRTFWEMVIAGMTAGHMVITVVCLFLPQVVRYCLPLPDAPSPPRRELRPLY